MSESTTPCPYCQAICECDWADVGVGLVQCGPYHCEACGAIERGAYDDSAEDQARVDPKTGWFPPSEDPRPGSSANMLHGRLATVADTRATYHARFAPDKQGRTDHGVPGAVEEFFARHREARQ